MSVKALFFKILDAWYIRKYKQIQPSQHDKTVKRLMMLMGLVALLNGCSVSHEVIKFDPTLMSSQWGGDRYYKLEGKALVLTDPDDDQRITSFAPPTICSDEHILDIQLGAFAAGGATLAFGKVFTDGADWRNPPTQFDTYKVIVRPYVSSFFYDIDNCGTWSPLVAKMEATVSISIFDNKENMIWEHSYQSGPFQNEPADASGSNFSSLVSTALHQKIKELMARATFDFANTQMQKIAPFLQLEQ